MGAKTRASIDREQKGILMAVAVMVMVGVLVHCRGLTARVVGGRGGGQRRRPW